MNLNSWTFALVAAALLFTSAASANLPGPGVANMSDRGAWLATSARVQPRLDVSSATLTLRHDDRRAEAMGDLFRSWSYGGSLPWLPAEMIDGVDALRFDRLDPRTGERTVFADATWGPLRDDRAR